MLSFLNKPLPATEFGLGSLFRYFLVGVFVAFFLLVFQPFEINQWQTSYKTLKLIGYGFVSFLVPALYSFLLFLFVPKKFTEDRWTVGKEIFSILLVLFLIALADLFYNNLINIMRISAINFINALIPVLLLGIFPVGVLVWTRHNHLLKRNTALAEAANYHLQQESLNLTQQENEEPADAYRLLVFVAENGKDKVELKKEALLYIESADNYSSIVFVENGEVKRPLIRSSLKRLESQLSHPDILRCHRTFIVNLKNVTKVEGNAAGYKLSFEASKNTVPVSRNFGPIIIGRLKSLK